MSINVNAMNMYSKPYVNLNNNKLSNLNRISYHNKPPVERTFAKRMTLPNYPLPRSTSTNPEKKFTSLFKQREIEYDKNLRCIKSNLFENKFKNLSVNPIPKENSNNLRRGSTFKFVNKKNVVDNTSRNGFISNIINANSNCNSKTIYNNNENKNFNNIRERSRSGAKKKNSLDRLKTTPAEFSEQKSQISELKHNYEKFDSIRVIQTSDANTQVNLEINNKKENIEQRDNFESMSATHNTKSDEKLHTINSNKNSENRDYYNFNLIEDRIVESDLKIFDKYNKEIKFDFNENYLDENDHEMEHFITDTTINNQNYNKETKSEFNSLIKSKNIESDQKIKSRESDSLDMIIKENKENILDLNEKSLLELYMKDDLIFVRSDLKTEDRTVHDNSKSKTKFENNLMTKSIDELFNIERLFENTIPIHSIDYLRTSERKLNLHSIKNIRNPAYDGEFLNYKLFQENVNKINLGILTLNYENLKLNKEYRAKFTQEEYRLLLSAFLRFDYGKGILEEFHKTEESNYDFLSRHEITERMRVKMIDWMIEVLTNYKCEESTYFLAVDLMDRFFKYSKKILKPDDLHLIGICCMFISSKFYDIYPIKLKIVSEKISHNKYNPEDIKNMEDQIVKALNYNILLPTAWDFVNFFLEEIFYFIENNFMISDDTLSQYIKGLCRNAEIEIKIDCLYYEKLKNTRKFNNTVMSLLRHIVLYLTKMNCHDYNLISIKPSLNAASTLFVGLKICGQINKEDYMNEYFLNKLVEVSKHSEYDILSNAQKILYNAQNFERIFPNLENLKRVHFNHILGYREKF
jgi:hypothetical protein